MQKVQRVGVGGGRIGAVVGSYWGVGADAGGGWKTGGGGG